MGDGAVTREIEIERPASTYAQTRGWFEFKIEKANKNGIPDRCYIRDGRVVFVEYKAPGKVPTKQQLLRHQQMRDAGAEVIVIDNLDVAYEVFR